MVRIAEMARSDAGPVFPIDRRALLAGLGAAALAPPALSVAPAMGQQARLLQARPDVLKLGAGGPEIPVWSLGGPELRFRRGDSQTITFENGLPVPIVLNWRGLDGAPATEALAARHPLATGAKDTFQIPLRHAGTFLCEPMCDLGHVGDGQARPSRGLPLIIPETEAVGVDRDEVLLIEQWQLRPDGAAFAPGADPRDARPVYSINGQMSQDIPARINERLRFRIINSCQRTVIAIKFENTNVRAMALDGQPAEPFLARNGALVLAPGGRVDAFIDVSGPAGTTSAILLHDGKEAHPIGRLTISNEPPIRTAPLPPAPPLPSNGLPAQLDLKNALRVDLPLGGAAAADWVTPSGFSTASAPAFRVKPGRVVVLALTNRGTTANVFHLHGHHFRLLDRLDDGWKPFWLDTLAVEPGTTQRVAFAAEHAGPWLLEQVATDWAAPRLVRWYSVA